MAELTEARLSCFSLRVPTYHIMFRNVKRHTPCQVVDSTYHVRRFEIYTCVHVRVCALVCAGGRAVTVGSASANDLVDLQTHAGDKPQ